MANFDEDAVIEMLARLRPTLDAMQVELDALKARPVRKPVKQTVEYDNGDVEVFEVVP